MASFDELGKKESESNKPLSNRSSLESRGKQLLSRRSEKMRTKSVQEVRILEQISQDLAEIEKLTENKEMDLQEKIDRIVHLNDRTTNLKRLSSRLEAGRMHGAQKQFQTGVRTALGARQQTETIHSASKSVYSLGQASETAKEQDTFQIESTIEKNQSLLAKQNERVKEIASQVGSEPGAEGRFTTAMGIRDKLMSNIGQAKQAMDLQKRQGGDVRSQFIDYNKLADSIKEGRRDQEISDKAQSGELGSYKDVAERLKSTEDKFLETIEKFNKALAEGSEEAGKFGKELDQISSDYRDQSKQVGAIAAAGGGGGGLLSGMLNALGGSAVRGASDVAAASGRMMQYKDVGSELQVLGQRTQFAEFANQRFSDATSATEGNASALRRVLTNAISEQATGGQKLGNAMDTALNVEMAGRLGQATHTMANAGINAMDPTATGSGAGIASGAGKFLGKLGSYVAPVAKGAAVAGDLASAGASIMDQNAQTVIGAYKGIPQNNAALQGATGIRALQDATNSINDQVSQATMDYFKGVGVSTRGLGANRENMMQALTSTGGRGALAMYGMTDQDVAETTMAGKSALGAELNFEDLAAAGQMRKGGRIDSTSQYMQMRGALSGVGAGAERLDEILKNAVTAGMDNSKNLMQMTAATVQLSQQSATAGIQNTAGVAEMLGKGVQNLDHLPKNMRASVAASAVEGIDDITGGGGISFENLLEMKRLREMSPDAEPLTLERMARVTGTQAMSLKKAFGESEEAGRKAAADMGLEGVITSENVEEFSKSKSKKLLQGLMHPGMTKHEKEINEKFGGKWEDLSVEARNAISSLALNRPEFGGKVSGRALWGSGLDFEKAKQTVPEDPGKISSSAEGTISGAAAIKDFQVFSDGVKNFDKTIGGLQNLGNTLKSVASSINANEMAQTTKEAASEMKLAGDAVGKTLLGINNTLGQFKSAMEDLIGKIKGGTPGINNGGHGMDRN